MRYKYVFFDIDDTLVDFIKSFEEAAKKVLELGGHAISKEYTDEYFRNNDDMWFGLNLHHVEDPYILENYHRLYRQYLFDANVHSKETMNLNGTPTELMECFKKELGKCAITAPYAVEVCQTLSANHVLCIATNGLTDVQPGKLTQFNEYLDKIFISEAVGFIKPQKEYFDYILKELDATPDECIMVGDSLPNDIDGANLSGIASCYYNPEHKINDSGIIPTYEIDDFRQLLEIV